MDDQLSFFLGGPGHTIFASYTSVLLIGAGSGITFPLGVARDLLHKAYAGQVRATTVDLVWIIRTQDIARPMIQELHALVEQAKRLEAERYKENATAFRVHVYITRSPACSPLDLLPMPFSQRHSTGDDSPVDSILSQQPSLSRIYRSGLEVTGRRPDVLDLVNRSTLEASGAGGANGCAVAVCGPMGLVTDVRQAVAAVEESTRLACGGIELQEAAFAL
jgi:ferric-chelate reductase